MPNYIKRQGTIIDKSECVLIVDPETELIGVPASDVQDLDYAFYRMFGWDWEQSDAEIKIQSNLSNDSIMVSGKRFCPFFKGSNEDTELISFFTKMIEEYKQLKNGGNHA